MLTLVALSAGCAARQDTKAPSPADMARVIVRFATAVRDPADPAFLERLAADAHVSHVEVIRPMSGDSWVLRIDCADPAARAAPAAPCAAALARLAAFPIVQFVERDDRATHQ